MKVHLLQVLVIDHDHLGADEVERVLEDANYPNDCIAPSVIKSQSAEIGNWDDDNPLNHSDTQAAEVDRLFSQTLRPMENAPDNEFVLLFSGEFAGKIPLRFDVCKFFADWGGWRNYAGELFGAEPVGWLPLPSAR